MKSNTTNLANTTTQTSYNQQDVFEERNALVLEESVFTKLF